MTSPKRIFWLLATIGVVSGCDDRSAEPEPELPAPATEQAPTRVEEKTPRVLQDSDRVEIYAEVLRQVLRKEQTPRSGALVDASGLLGLDDQQRHEVLVALEPIEPRAFFGTRDDVLRKAKESEEERDRDETARKNKAAAARERSGSSTAATPVEFTPVAGDEAPMLVLTIEVRSFTAQRASIVGSSWHLEAGDKRTHYAAAWSDGRWRVREDRSGGIEEAG